MIVYNVQRRWFGKKADADAFRVGLRLPPASAMKVEIGDRADLSALLNALCEPGSDRVAEANLPVSGDPQALIDRAFVSPHITVPDFVPKFLVEEMRGRGYAL